MIVTRLRVANLRAMEAAEFRFQPGFNLIVGVNGVGKTSVLNALAVCFSAITKQASSLRGRVEAFATSDIRIGAEALTVECGVRIGDRNHNYLVHKPRATSAPQKRKTGMPREQIHDTPGRAEFLGDGPSRVSDKEPGGRPLAVLFSTNRAVPTERVPAKNVSAGGVAAAFADAFADRELRLRDFASWMRVQQALTRERRASHRALTALEESVMRFLPGYGRLRLGGKDRRQLWIERAGTAIPVRQLSDGERGILALVLDLTRRLAQANPHCKDPAGQAGAVVLIDEIELHLHPKWQREIIQNLEVTFPQCQFIATTHSPQVIGELENDRIQIMVDGQVYPAAHSYGVDSNRVLEEVMGAEPRTKEIQDLLTKISKATGRREFARGRDLLGQLVKRLGENDPEVTRIRTLLDFVEGKE